MVGSVNSNDHIPELEPYEDEYSAQLRRIEKLAHLFDARFEIPGTKIRFGWDGLIGLLPGVGATGAMPSNDAASPETSVCVCAS